MSQNKKGPAVRAPNCVTIFGGGVAGMTAAHELIERGFRVQLWEPQLDQRFPWRGCAVGGMARTQWSRVHWPHMIDSSAVRPRVEPYEFELRGSSDGESWAGIPRSSAAQVGASLTKSIPSSDDEAIIDVEVRYTWARHAGETAFVGEDVEPSNAEERNAPHEYRVRKKALKIAHACMVNNFAAIATDDERALYIPRKDARPISVMLTLIREDPWVASAMLKEEALTLRFFYTPPWGKKSDPIEHLPQKFYLRYPDNWDSNQAPEANGKKGVQLLRHWGFTVEALGEYGSPSVGAVLQELVLKIAKNPQLRHIYLEVVRRRRENASDGDRGWDKPVALALREELTIILKKTGGNRVDVSDLPWVVESTEHMHTGIRLQDGRIIVITAARIQDPEPSIPGSDDHTSSSTDYHIALSFRIREHWLPGEHGYRFFPSFYHHVFDTMKRTPILEPIEKSALSKGQERSVKMTPDQYKYVETFRTVKDNLASQKYTALAFNNGEPPKLFNRYAFDSVDEAAETYRAVVSGVAEGGLGYGSLDLARSTLKGIQYLTTCSERRRELEDVSWWDFVGADDYSPGAQFAIANFPKALVAMDAVEGDARTIGSAGGQTVLDQFKKSAEFRDGTLTGPTSEAWFKYWQRYLEAQGVEFIHGKLSSFCTYEQDNQTRLRPVVECYEPRFPFVGSEDSGFDDGQGEPALMAGYVVLALPAEEIKRLGRKALDVHPELDHRDLRRAANLALGDSTQPSPDGELRHFAGIQFYFDEDVLWIDGHVYFPESPWALTSISQARFWSDRHDWEHGYRGIVSAIVGKWDAPGRHTTSKTAWECTEEEVAREVWEQLRLGLEARDGPLGGRLPRPLYYHLDDFMRPKSTGHGGWENSSPFQIETPGRYQARPGELEPLGYCTGDGIVLCGTHMKTHTRITTMEAANESARHAVNAILRDVGSPYRRTPCEVWPIEEREIADFDFWKEVDRQRFHEGKAHLIEDWGTEKLLKAIFIEGRDADSITELWDRYRALAKQWLASN